MGLTKCNPELCRNSLCNGWLRKSGTKTNHVVLCRFAGHCTEPDCKGVGILQNGFQHLKRANDDTVEEYRQFKPMNRNLGAFVKGNKNIDDDADEKTSTSASSNTSKGCGKGVPEPSYHVPRAKVSTILTNYEKNQSWGALCENSDDELESLQNKIAKSEQKTNELREKAKKLEQDACIQKIKKEKESIQNVKDSLDKIETIGQFEETVEFWIETVKRIVPADDHKDLIQYLMKELDSN